MHNAYLLQKPSSLNKGIIYKVFKYFVFILPYELQSGSPVLDTCFFFIYCLCYLESLSTRNELQFQYVFLRVTGNISFHVN